MNIITITTTTTITTTIMLKKKRHFLKGIFGGLKKLMNFALEVQKKKKAHAKHLGGGWRKKSYEGESALC